MKYHDHKNSEMFPGVLSCALYGHEDERGVFCELYRQADDLMLINGIRPMKQVNLSISKAGTFRGMHSQLNNPQGKMITVFEGNIIDFYGDGKNFEAQELLQGQSIYIPPGLFHGFYAKTDSLIVYGCTEVYDEKSAVSLSYKALPVEILEKLESMIEHISEKDANAPMGIV